MMLNSKIPLPQRSISSSGLDFAPRNPPSTTSPHIPSNPGSSSGVTPAGLLSSPPHRISSSLSESPFPRSSKIPIPSSSSSFFSSSNSSFSSSSSNLGSSSSLNGGGAGSSSPTKKQVFSPSKIPLPVNTEVQTNRVMRKYETFVMTGERMLCITKTPAKHVSHNKSLPASMPAGEVDAVDTHPSKNNTLPPSSLPLNNGPREEEDMSFFKPPEKKREGPVVHSPEPPPPPPPPPPEHDSESISPPSSPVDRMAEDLNESISSSSSSSASSDHNNEPEPSTDSLRGPSMIPFIPVDPASEGDSDLESLHSYHPPPKIVDIPSAIRLAKRLYHLDGFRKSDVSRHLSRNNEYNQVVAEEYLKFFDFSNLTLDGALRLFLSQFCLTGETQERERVLFYFSKRYRECNPDTKTKFLSSDAVHTLTCAIMLLNTDLHGDSGQRKMTSGEFIKNLSELNEGQDFPRELLKSLYYAIKHEPIPWALNNGEGQLRMEAAPLSESTHEGPRDVASSSSRSGEEDASGQDKSHHIAAAGGASNLLNTSSHLLPKPINLGSGVNPFLALPDPMSSTDYKKGYVMRKCCVDPNGKKTKLGRRSWKMYYLSLRDMVLYCFKDEKSLRAPGAFEDLNQAIRIHHGLAVRASDYTKKQFVFRLHTCDQAEYLFQTSDEKELLTWIDAINYVVASFSSPKLPAPISSSHSRFQRPLLPSSKSKLSPGEQLSENESALSELRRDLEEHLQHPPHPKNSSMLAYFKDKQDYLSFEVQRYETYILTLRTKFTSEQSHGDTEHLLQDRAKSLEKIY